MSETFFIKQTLFDDFSNDISLRESTSFVIGPGELDGPGGRTRNTDLELHGFGALKWGEGVNQNLFRMLENNACPEKTAGSPPVSIIPPTPMDEVDLGLGNGITTPIIGQTWFNATDGELYMFGVTGWTTITATTNFNNIAALAAHAADDSLHLTALQNTFMDGLNLPTLEADEVNTLDGISLVLGGGTVQGQLDLMVEKAGDIMTGNLQMASAVEIWFEGGDSRITNNDGGGDFNIRVGNYYDAGAMDELYRQTNQGAVHLLATHEPTGSPTTGGPSFTVRVSEDFTNAISGQPVVWTNETVFENNGNVSVSTLLPTNPDHLTTKDYVDTEITDSITDVLNAIYPIGSIYISFNSSIPPAFPGNWQQTLRGRFLIGEGTSDQLFNAGTTGGASQHQLTIAQMPAHNHGGGSHSHSLVMGGGSSGPRWAIAVDAHPNAGHSYPGGEKTGTTSSITTTQGSNSPHNNLPPYQTTYIFTRTS